MKIIIQKKKKKKIKLKKIGKGYSHPAYKRLNMSAHNLFFYTCWVGLCSSTSKSLKLTDAGDTILILYVGL